MILDNLSEFLYFELCFYIALLKTLIKKCIIESVKDPSLSVSPVSVLQVLSTRQTLHFYFFSVLWMHLSFLSLFLFLFMCCTSVI